MTPIVEVDVGAYQTVWVFEDHGTIFNREALSYLRGPQGFFQFQQAMVTIAQLERKSS